jgi:SHS2 domain-containing protein
VAEHVGELKVALHGSDLEGVFAALARAIADECGPVSGEHSEWKSINLAARDLHALVVDWCNEVLGICEIDHVAYGESRKIRITDERSIEAELRGRRVTTWLSPLKAATFHGLNLEQRDDGWHCTIIFDV